MYENLTLSYYVQVDVKFLMFTDGYLNSYMSGKSIWDANPHLQAKATELVGKLRADYETDVKARTKTSWH